MLRRIINRLRFIRREYLNNNQTKILIKNIKSSKSQNRIFLFQTPTHSNIGDHAIADAEIDFFKKYLPNYKIFEINQDLTPLFIKKDINNIKDSDIIFLHGGGNFGNEYMREENLRRLIVKNYPENKIILFPQTIHFSNDDIGNKELEITQNLFKTHKNLTLTAREEISFQLMKKYFPENNVILTPDIVLSYLKIDKKTERDYALQVIREDQESILSDLEKRTVHELLSSNYEKVISSDMHVENFNSVRTPEERDLILKNKFKQFQQAKIVITDRLHGMVFAIITGTPCIVFSNYNHKVLGTYNWIKDLEYIKFVNNIDEAKIAFDELTALNNYEFYNPKLLEQYYNPLIDVLNEK